MATITIDGKEYDSDHLSDEVKAQLMSLQFCDAELQRYQALAAATQTARMAYANALRELLEKNEATSCSDDNSSGEKKKKGLMSFLGKK